MKKLMTAILLLSLALGLCACVSEKPDGTNETEGTKQTEATQESTAATENKGDAYVVTVVDTEGKPVAGVMLQLCKLGEGGICMPSFTPSNAEGKVWFDLEKDSYKASIITMPAGYTYVDEAVKDFYFDGDSKELTIVLKKA